MLYSSQAILPIQMVVMYAPMPGIQPKIQKFIASLSSCKLFWLTENSIRSRKAVPLKMTEPSTHRQLIFSGSSTQQCLHIKSYTPPSFPKSKSTPFLSLSEPVKFVTPYIDIVPYVRSRPLYPIRSGTPAADKEDNGSPVQSP